LFPIIQFTIYYCTWFIVLWCQWNHREVTFRSKR